MTVLLTGATGKVGSEVQALMKLWAVEYRVMSRANGLDFMDPSSWDTALRGIDSVCLITPALENEEEIGRAFIRKAIAAGVRHISLLSIHNARLGKGIPHFDAKVGMEEEILNANISYTFIQPNNFYQNDMYFIEGIKSAGVYIQPLGDIGLSRVDARDVALALFYSLLDSSHKNQSYPLVGPEVWTAEKTANAYARALGKDVKTVSVKEWSQAMKGNLPEWLREEWHLMYEFFTQNGLRASATDLIKQGKILNQAPRKFEDYMKEIV